MDFTRAEQYGLVRDWHCTDDKVEDWWVQFILDEQRDDHQEALAFRQELRDLWTHHPDPHRYCSRVPLINKPGAHRLKDGVGFA